MPIPLIFIGVLLIVTGINDKYPALFKQLASDMTGSGGFLVWIAAVLIVGFVGYFGPYQTVSRAMLALILIVYITKSGGLFQRIQEAVTSGGTRSASSSSETPVPEVIPIEASGSLPIELKSPSESKPIVVEIKQGGGGGGGGGLGGMSMG